MTKAIIFDCFGVLVGGGLDLAYLQELAKDYKLAVLSSSNQEVLKLRLSPAHQEIFKVMVTPAETRRSKADPEIYRLAAYKLDAEPSECIFVDDARLYCRTAQEAGMAAVQYRDFDQLRHDLSQLLKTL